jgi:hypothetical protein
MSFDRGDTGVRPRVLRVWNGSENYLCVVRRNLFVGATVNCRYHAEASQRATRVLESQAHKMQTVQAVRPNDHPPCCAFVTDVSERLDEDN